FSFWVYPTDNTNVYLMGNGNSSNGRGLRLISNGQIRIHNGGFQQYDAGIFVSQNDFWHHIAIVYHSDGVRLYKTTNGGVTSVFSSNISEEANTSSILYIGARSNNKPEFRGYMDDIRIYDRALSEIEIRKLATGFQKY
ncbi:MAG: LamG domain-containing protein, partial [Proteobacteria bacterium]|nr:LamG domain-containing protein [Pseudomonadota bacterium]